MNQRKGTPLYILFVFMAVQLGIMLAVLPGVYGPVILPDEFGYWTHAAAMAGYDWTEVAGQFSWYSYGYGLLMFPFMKALSDPVVMYRWLVGANFLLMCACIPLLYGTLTRIFPDRERRALAAASGAGMLYVSCVTYAQTTMAESLLTFLYILLAYGVMRWLERPCLWSGALPVLTAGCMYMVHLRSIGIVLGTGFCMVLMVLARKRESGDSGKAVKIFFLLSGIALLLLAAGLVKESLISGSASEYYRQAARRNDYSGQWGKLLYLCSLDGICRFLAGLAGKLFYLGCASFGLYYWGAALLLRKVREIAAEFGKRTVYALRGIICKEQKDCPPSGWISLWTLLTHGSALLITIIFCLQSDRLDGLLYGRYHENTVPLVMALGVLEILEHPEGKKRLLWLPGILGCCFFGVYALLGRGDILYTNRHSVTGMLYALDLSGRDASKTMLYAYLAGAAGGGLLLAAAGLKVGRWRGYVCVLAVCLLQGALSFYAGKNLVLAANEGQKEDVELLVQTRQMLAGGHAGDVCYLYGGKSRQMCLAQYMLQEVSVHLVLADGQYRPQTGEILILQKGDGGTKPPGGCTRILESPRYVVYRCGP